MVDKYSDILKSYGIDCFSVIKEDSNSICFDIPRSAGVGIKLRKIRDDLGSDAVSIFDIRHCSCPSPYAVMEGWNSILIKFSDKLK